jgi:hypothetical protein
MMRGRKGQGEKATLKEYLQANVAGFAAPCAASVGFRRNTAQNEILVTETNEWPR